MQYQLIDSGDGRRLEQFGKYILDRPDPEVMWNKSLSNSEWQKADAVFINGEWKTKPNFPERWEFEVNNLKVYLRLTPFKHVGIFPEQLPQWERIAYSVKRIVEETKTQPHILNLFGYTGVASLHALEAGAKVTHVDASRSAITWFKENQNLSNLSEKPARIILDDCFKFVEREIKRGNKYDGIIMDPPVYGHGPKGEPWNFNKDFSKLVTQVSKLLSDNPFFVIVNAYAVSTSPTTIANTLVSNLPSGNVIKGELELMDKSGRSLSTGIWAIWQKTS